MTLLQAAMKDISAKKWKENKLMKRIGHPSLVERDQQGNVTSFFPRRACLYCDSLQIFEYYEPIAAGRQFWCWDCGSINLECTKPRNKGKDKKETQTIGRKRQPRMDITKYKLIERY